MNSMPENFPDTGAGCADRRYLIRSEAEGDDIELRAGSIEGLPSVYITEESDVVEDVLIVVDGMQAPGNYPALRAGTVYTIFKVIGDFEAEVACIHCKALRKDKGSRQHYVVSVGRAYLPKVQILDAWREGVPVSWRDLDPVYGYPWISACMSLASPFNWRQTLVTGLVVLDVAGLRTEDDLYCHLGEALFGYRGYAGSNLAAFEDVLRHNEPARITFSIPDEAEFDAFLARTTRRSGHAGVFKQIIGEAGAALRIERRGA
ncbi:Barstar (barnase inhibitor) [Variovorax sp. OK605]|uniref:barstar family protein n=1 Tax=Variovorax sp. OK605 TaxID=1855317 RepID=UPI0008E9933F|nr:barstar family protein [Variovorax sp. OK605]SFQ68312.1 Barstar (barnase inhibitor) [Variovorax sp. OK605]